ncbi:MAG TPA: DJ-1/PfpI family protein [Steroidobacteraceae bacterium]|jgi:transcriptional regulator GlxA family with amidase domain|nr:DJ-1/PfpI family protein [Steroidobacteraceae bacterium]
MDTQFTVVFALYPRMTQLDFTGPLEVFARLPGAHCVLASRDGGTLEAAASFALANVARLRDIGECALLCVPGGFGTVAALEDREYLAQLRRLAASARYVTSVCTGSLLLAAAGLLVGRRAACHWAWRDSLAAFGVVVDDARVVRDGNVITGGGVTAGIDMALTVMAEIAGAAYAQSVQLAIEYAPMPPFCSGRPEQASPQVVAAALKRLEPLRGERDAAVARAAAALAGGLFQTSR